MGLWAFVGCNVRFSRSDPLERSLSRTPRYPPSSTITALRHRNARPLMKAVGSAPADPLRRASYRRLVLGPQPRRGETWHSRARPWAVRQPAPTGGLLSHEASQHRKPRTPASMSALGFWLGASTNGRALMPGVEEPAKRGVFALVKKAATKGRPPRQRQSRQMSILDENGEHATVRVGSTASQTRFGLTAQCGCDGRILQ